MSDSVGDNLGCLALGLILLALVWVFWTRPHQAAADRAEAEIAKFLPREDDVVAEGAGSRGASYLIWYHGDDFAKYKGNQDDFVLGFHGNVAVADLDNRGGIRIDPSDAVNVASLVLVRVRLADTKTYNLESQTTTWRQPLSDDRSYTKNYGPFGPAVELKGYECTATIVDRATGRVTARHYFPVPPWPQRTVGGPHGCWNHDVHHWVESVPHPN